MSCSASQTYLILGHSISRKSWLIEILLLALALSSLSNASVIPAGYKVPDEILGVSLSDIPLLIEPITDSDIAIGCPNPSRVCPRIVTPMSSLEMDLRKRGGFHLRSSSTPVLSSAQQAAGANIAFYIYEYVPQVFHVHVWRFFR